MLSHGLDPAALLAETQAGTDEAAARTYELVDRFIARVVPADLVPRVNSPREPGEDPVEDPVADLIADEGTS